MRLLKFNGEQVDIDEKTAIGIDFQAYDVSEPGSRKVASSNKFTVPLTARNLRLTGFPGDPQSISKTVYSRIKCEYWNQNKKLIQNGIARITEVSDRISVLAYEKSDVWTKMEDYYWPGFQSEFITWLQEKKGLPSADNPFAGTFSSFIAQYLDTTEGVILPLFISNLALFDPDDGENYIESLGSIYIKYNNTVDGEVVDALGGHFCAYCNTIFEFIEYKFGVDFSATDTSFDYNIFQDTIASIMYTPLRNLSIRHTSTGFYFLYDNEAAFVPEETTDDKGDKTLYGFTRAFFQHFNCLIDRVPMLDNSEKYIIRRFDDISNAPVIDLSGKLKGKPKFKPTIDGYSQNNWIKFSSIHENGDGLANSKKIVCKNKNLDAGSPDDSLFDIDAYIPGGYKAGGNVVLDMSPSGTFGQFTFFVSSGQMSTIIKSVQGGAEVTANVIIRIAQLYSLDSEYNTLASIVEYPVFWEVKRWLTLHEVESLVYFAKYFVKELNGYFFLNKIAGYNPEKSNEATTLELIKIPD